MRIYRRTLGIGGSTTDAANFDAVGTFVRCLKSTYPFTLEVQGDGGIPLAVFDGFELGLQFEIPAQGKRFAVKNSTSASEATAAQEIIIAIHDGRIDDNRLVGTVNITGGIASKTYAPDLINTAAAVTATTGGVSCCTAATQIGTLLIQNLGAVAVYVGPTASLTTANGIQLDPSPGGGVAGGFIELQTAAAISVRTASSTSDVRVLRTQHS